MGIDSQQSSEKVTKSEMLLRFLKDRLGFQRDERYHTTVRRRRGVEERVAGLGYDRTEVEEEARKTHQLETKRISFRKLMNLLVFADEPNSMFHCKHRHRTDSSGVAWRRPGFLLLKTAVRNSPFP